jgi:hypothetical protein
MAKLREVAPQSTGDPCAVERLRLVELNRCRRIATVAARSTSCWRKASHRRVGIPLLPIIVVSIMLF